MENIKKKGIYLIIGVFFLFIILEKPKIVSADDNLNVKIITASLDISSGDVISSNARAVSERIYIAKENVEVKVGNSSVKYGVFYYDANGKYIGWSGWTTSDTYKTAANTAYVRILLGYNDNRTVRSSEIAVLEKCLNISDRVESANLKLGVLDIKTGQEIVSTARSITGKYDLAKKNVKVKVGNSGAKYGVFYYDANGKYIGWSGWTTSDTYKTAANTAYVRILLGYNDNRTVGSSEIAVLEKCLNISDRVESANLKLGVLDIKTGQEIVSTARSITGKYDLAKKNVKVKIGNSGAKYGVFYYDANGKYIGWSGWTTSDTYKTAANTAYVRILLGYNDNRTVGSSEIAVLEKCLNISDRVESANLKLGVLDIKTGQEIVSTARSITGKYDLAKKNVKVKIGNSGAKYGVFYYDANGKYIGWSGWTTSDTYKTAANTAYVRILLGYNDNRTVGSSEIAVLEKCLNISDRVESANLKLGVLDIKTGQEIVSTARSITGKYDLAKKNVKVKVGNSGAKYGVFYYDANGKYIGWSGWTTSDTYKTAANTAYVRILLGYNDNRTVGSSEIAVLEKCLIIFGIGNKDEWELPIM